MEGCGLSEGEQSGRRRQGSGRESVATWRVARVGGGLVAPAGSASAEAAVARHERAWSFLCLCFFALSFFPKDGACVVEGYCKLIRGGQRRRG